MELEEIPEQREHLPQMERLEVLVEQQFLGHIFNRLELAVGEAEQLQRAQVAPRAQTGILVVPHLQRFLSEALALPADLHPVELKRQEQAGQVVESHQQTQQQTETRVVGSPMLVHQLECSEALLDQLQELVTAGLGTQFLPVITGSR